MLDRASFLTLLAASASALPATTRSSESRFGPNIAAHEASKLYFGTATNNYELNDTAYFALLDDLAMFGQLTPAKAMKWVRIIQCAGSLIHLPCPRTTPSRSAASSPSRWATR